MERPSQALALQAADSAFLGSAIGGSHTFNAVARARVLAFAPVEQGSFSVELAPNPSSCQAVSLRRGPSSLHDQPCRNAQAHRC